MHELLFKKMLLKSNPLGKEIEKKKNLIFLVANQEIIGNK